MKKLFYISLASVLMISCAKENSDVFVPYANNPLNDTVWTAEPLATASVNQLGELFSVAPKLDSFEVVPGATIKSTHDLEVTFPPASCNAPNGTPVTGRVKVEIIYLRTKGDMIRAARPTTSFNRLLESGGAVYIKVTKDGQEVVPAPNKTIIIKLRDANPNSLMKVFYGEQSSTSTPGNNFGFTWVPAPDSARVVPFQRQDTSGSIIRGYDLFSKRFRWVNCDYFIDSTLPKTRINTLLPVNFTNSNSSVYAVFKEQKIVVRLNSEVSSRTFFTINMPLNKNITLIALSKIGDDLFLASKDFLVVPNLTTQLSPERKTKQQITQFLDAL